MADNKKPESSENKSISISGDVKDSVVIVGDNNQTFFQKVINSFKSDSETLEHRNRRILLGHVENAWIKGVLDASLHGAALLDLGIKQDPEAVTKYPWAIKKESTDETLPTGLSMLEIFDSIGMGRSLLILGAPGSGKTTMLLELARGLITRAREDVTQPIPMVFNLASWTEKLTLADWLAQELNNLYSVPRKTAPDWVKGNKLLLLLDGLDEVRQESRAKCVEAINEFRKQNGLTSLAVCSRSQDYADLNAKLSFEGAIEVQPLTQKQIAEFFNRFGDEMAGIKQALEKDSGLREMAETPLFLSIMLMAYQGKRNIEILVSEDEKAQRKHLFDTYIARMIEYPRTKNVSFKNRDVLHWLSWLASKMEKHSQISYSSKTTESYWLYKDKNLSKPYKLFINLLIGSIFVLIGNLFFSLLVGWVVQLISLLTFVLIFSLSLYVLEHSGHDNFDTGYYSFTIVVESLIFSLVYILIFMLVFELSDGYSIRLRVTLIILLLLGLMGGLIGGLLWGMTGENPQELANQTNQRIYLLVYVLITLPMLFFKYLLSHRRAPVVARTKIPSENVSGLEVIVSFPFLWIIVLGIIFFRGGKLLHDGLSIIAHYGLRFFLFCNNLLPWRLVPFLDHCVDLIFLRRVGGGYIFIHRLLMEHFAEMYMESPTSKGN